MNASELLRIVDAIHRDKNIEKDIVFDGIESALVSAAKKLYGEEEEIVVSIDRETGQISGTHNDVSLDPELIGRIGAQTAKQVMIQKIREAERDALFAEYDSIRGDLINGIVQRVENGTATVSLSNTESILPRSEQIPGESYHVNERVRATIYEVRKAGSRVKVVLSRIRPDLVRRLFEQEIPEIAEGVIEINALAREAGYRSKVAVSSSDQRVDCVGACVGVRGNRIKNIVDELAGERIDIVRWNDDMQILIPNALQPAEVDEVILCQMLGRAIVLVLEDQLSLAIGRRGQNVRLASKLCVWDIEIMTREELDDQLENAVVGFAALEGLSEELSEKLVGEGFLSFDDLSVIEPEDLMEMGGLTAEQVDAIVAQAEVKAEEAEHAAAEERRRQREQERLAVQEAKRAAEAAAQEAAEAEAQEQAPTEEAADAVATESAESTGPGEPTAADEASIIAQTTAAVDSDESAVEESPHDTQGDNEAEPPVQPEPSSASTEPSETEEQPTETAAVPAQPQEESAHQEPAAQADETGEPDESEPAKSETDESEAVAAESAGVAATPESEPSKPSAHPEGGAE